MSLYYNPAADRQQKSAGMLDALTAERGMLDDTDAAGGRSILAHTFAAWTAHRALAEIERGDDYDSTEDDWYGDDDPHERIMRALRPSTDADAAELYRAKVRRNAAAVEGEWLGPYTTTGGRFVELPDFEVGRSGLEI